MSSIDVYKVAVSMNSEKSCLRLIFLNELCLNECREIMSSIDVLK